jgi:hypothetical protein
VVSVLHDAGSTRGAAGHRTCRRRRLQGPDAHC